MSANHPAVAGSRNMSAAARWRLLLVLLGALAGAPAPAATNQTLVIGDDRGGSIIARARLIRTYRASGTRIEIRGRFCLSACTMYLRLPNTCVAPGTTFGFHGPASAIYGIALQPELFERWSRVMAEHYPEPLRSWFMRTGRNRIVGFHEFSGRDLIDMGIPGCRG